MTTGPVLHPATRRTLNDEDYVQVIVLYAESIAAGARQLRDAGLKAKDDSFVRGLLQELYDRDRDVWDLLEHIEDGRPEK